MNPPCEPCGWNWLSGGLAALALGMALLDRSEAFLIVLWGVGLLVIGTALAVVGTGLLLRIWR